MKAILRKQGLSEVTCTLLPGSSKEIGAAHQLLRFAMPKEFCTEHTTVLVYTGVKKRLWFVQRIFVNTESSRRALFFFLFEMDSAFSIFTNTLKTQ